jgi:hypothetical protein
VTSVFTQHVRNFRGEGDAPQDVLRELAELLRRRMRRRHLLSAPPAYLGYVGSNWEPGGPWEDLVSECYLYAFLESGRLEALKNHLDDFPTIDGLITRNVDHFLLERQRQNDFIGYAVHGNVEGAVGLARRAGLLQMESSDEGRLQSDSLLRFVGSPPDVAVEDPRKLRRFVEDAPDWNGALASLVRTTDAGRQWVFSRLQALAASGVGALRAGDLVGGIAAHARALWSARHGVPMAEMAYEGDDEAGQLVRMLGPDLSLENRERWEWLKQEVFRRIETLDRQQRVRERLRLIFEGMVRTLESGDSREPRQADLVRELDMPRATLSEQFALLRDIITQACVVEKPG